MAMVRVAAMLLARFLLPLLALAVVAYGANVHGSAGLPPISRRSFPQGFIFGMASSSYQVREFDPVICTIYTAYVLPLH
jgi:beta-glucosidase